MKREIINTKNAPAPIGPYSQAVKANGFIFVSGCIPIKPDTNELVSDVKEASKTVFTNLNNILEAGGSDIGNIVKITIFLSDMANFQEVNQIYSTFVKEPFPARTTVAVKDLPRSVCLEVDAIAIV
jgi:2-iminobutanoate/2-iminopropanoate deaminase